jgi:hypothetical protein
MQVDKALQERILDDKNKPPKPTNPSCFRQHQRKTFERRRRVATDARSPAPELVS